ncbi:MAG: fibronectin type III domain-containing protein [Candidatus Brocadiae bacterium]|nr:fibronectin type III domain-containing protein [Candidatus Brocadiia bacterium]
MSKKMVLNVLVLSLCVGVLAFGAEAATISAASCSRADVQAAIDAASDGDTVLVPAGSSVWEGGAAVPNNKRITLQGSGMASTALTNAKINLGRSGSRVTGFGFAVGLITVDGDGWRVDHCSFHSASKFTTSVSARGEREDDHPKGVVDHCVFHNGRVVTIGWAGLKADHLWASPCGLGTDRAVYVEDCQFTRTVHGNAVDTNYGGCYVFRHNVVTDSTTEAHSVQGDHRAARHWEIYENQFRLANRTAMWTPFFQRGGTGVVFNNTVSGSWTLRAIVLDNIRSYDSRGKEARQCDGGSTWDGNEPIDHGTGVHAGETGAAALTHAGKAWTPDALVGFYVYNVTDGSKGEITANTATTVTAALAGGVRNSWDTGDRYSITNGYPSRDQIGRSTDLHLWTDDTPYPPQLLEPAYAWGNTFNGKEMAFVALVDRGRLGMHVQEGRDYFNGTPRPGYRPYTYPHPLVQQFPSAPATDTEAPTEPQGLRARAVSGRQVELAWQASTDNEGVAGYYVWLAGRKMSAITDPTCTKYVFRRLMAPVAGYTFSVSAFDAAGNESQPAPAARAGQE